MGEQPPHPDTWDAARERARAEVHRVFAEGERACPRCGARSVTSGRICPRCGAPYVSRRAKLIVTPRTRLIAAGVIIALVALVGGLIALLAPGIDHAKHSQASATHLREAQVSAAMRKRISAEQRPQTAIGTARDPGATAAAGVRMRDRAALVADLQHAITADARARVRAGSLTGPVLYVKCSPYPSGSKPANTGLSARIGPYSCLAVNRAITNRTGVVGQLGDPFWARVDFATAQMVWCKITPRPGEQVVGQALVTVPLAPACDLTRPLPGPLRLPA